MLSGIGLRPSPYTHGMTLLLDEDALRALPKIALHDHLDGGLRPGTVLELAREAGVELPAEDESGLATWFAETSDSGSLVEYLKTFDLTVAVMQTEAALRRVAREAVLDLAADGVIYAELRWAPEQHLAGGLTLDEAVIAVTDGLAEGVAAAAAQGSSIAVGQLLTAMRHADRGLEIAELTVRHYDPDGVGGVVGFDIAGAELGFPPSKHKAAFDHLAEELVPTTIHAGEADGIDSIRDALVAGRALRIGHGVRLAEDIRNEGEDDTEIEVSLGPVADWIRDRGIALEVCPSSNFQTGAVDSAEGLAGHPFDLLYQLGFRVTVSSDNRLMSRTSLSRELALLADTFGYELDDIAQFQLNAAEAAFQPREVRDLLVERIHEAYAAAAAE